MFLHKRQAIQYVLTNQLQYDWLATTTSTTNDTKQEELGTSPHTITKEDNEVIWLVRSS